MAVERPARDRMGVGGLVLRGSRETTSQPTLLLSAACSLTSVTGGGPFH